MLYFMNNVYIVSQKTSIYAALKSKFALDYRKQNVNYESFFFDFTFYFYEQNHLQFLKMRMSEQSESMPFHFSQLKN